MPSAPVSRRALKSATPQSQAVRRTGSAAVNQDAVLITVVGSGKAIPSGVAHGGGLVVWEVASKASVIKGEAVIATRATSEQA